MQRESIQGHQRGRRLLAVGAACLSACLIVGSSWPTKVSAANGGDDPSFVTVERAGPVAPKSVLAFDDPALVAELQAELSKLPPSTRGFPRWLVHVFSGTDRQKSYAVFAEDLERFPSVARVVRDDPGAERFQYRVELSGSYWERADEVVASLRAVGRPVFYLGERSNWPAIEVVLTERLEQELPPVAAPASDEEAEARAEFFERVGPLLRNKTANRKLDVAYERLADQLFRHHAALVAASDVKQFTTRFRRYRWRGDGGARVAVRAEYRSPDRDSAAVIGRYFETRASEARERLDPTRFGLEILTTESSPAAVRQAVQAAFPGVEVNVRPGRPLEE